MDGKVIDMSIFDSIRHRSSDCFHSRHKRCGGRRGKGKYEDREKCECECHESVEE